MKPEEPTRVLTGTQPGNPGWHPYQRPPYSQHAGNKAGQDHDYNHKELEEIGKHSRILKQNCYVRPKLRLLYRTHDT